MAGINIIRRWVMGQMTKKADDGIMITLPDMKKVELNTNITIEKFLKNGIDPNAFTNTNQVENAINQLNKPKVVSQGDPRFKGIMSRMTGKNVIKGDFGPGFKKEIEKMKGKVDDDLPPPGSRGGADDIAAPVQSAEESLKDMIMAENKKNIAAMRNRKMIKDAVDNASPGFVKGDRKYNAQLVAEDLAEKKFGKQFDDLDQKQQIDLYGEALDGLSVDLEDFAIGGRVGLKKGSIDLARRGFMKAAAGVGAGIGALKMGALKLFGKEGARQVTKNVIKTDAVPGKPEWFDALVTKVINQGEDVTKRFATQEREIVHATKIGDDEMVTVYRNMDNGEIRVEYASPENMGSDTIDLVYKKPLPDESNPRPSAEFYAIEPEPRGIRTGPDDYDIEFDGENFANNVDELMSDTTKLKIFAKGDAKPTLKEFVESKKKKDKTKAINENTVEQAEYLETKYGPGPEDVEDFARGGIARMLGE